MTYGDKLDVIIDHYGVRNQLKKLNEESYELIEAIRDYEEQKQACEFIGCKEPHVDKCREHITEEIADCYVMLEQFRIRYDISLEKIKEVGAYKIDRQLERISKE